MHPRQRNYLQSLINIASNMRNRTFRISSEWLNWIEPYYEGLTEQNDKDKLMYSWETLRYSIGRKDHKDYKLAEAMLRRMVWIENKR